MNEIVNLTYCNVIHTDKIARNDRFNRPIYEANMHISHLDQREEIIQLYQEENMNKILEIITQYYRQPILILYARDQELLGVQDNNGIFIKFCSEQGKPNNIVIIDERFLMEQVNINFLYKFIYDHSELITNEDDILMYNEMTDVDKNNHLNEVKLILDRFFERYDPKLEHDKFDVDYIFEYCVDYSGHNPILEPKPYIKYISRENCIVKGN